MPTQYGEDKRILEYFAGRRGRFLDIGAGDGLTHSNTRPLLDAGWTGVMVEPAISQLRWLLENYADDPRVEILPYALGRGGDWSEFYDHRDWSTCLKSQKNLIDAHSKNTVSFRKRFVHVITWDELMDIADPPFEFVNIDAEGMCCELLACMPHLGQQMVCAEIDPPGSQTSLLRSLELMGITNHEVIGGNLLAWR